MGTPITRATIIWFVGAALVGAVAGALHLWRSVIGGGHPGTPLAVVTFGVTALAAVMLYRGLMTAAGEQDERASRGGSR
ncbi:MAG: hypothetical protein ABIS35_12690 [Terracoccus sp.]